MLSSTPIILERQNSQPACDECACVINEERFDLLQLLHWQTLSCILEKKVTQINHLNLVIAVMIPSAFTTKTGRGLFFTVKILQKYIYVIFNFREESYVVEHDSGDDTLSVYRDDRQRFVTYC